MKFAYLDFNPTSNKIEILFKKAGEYDIYMIFTPLKGGEQIISSKFKVIEATKIEKPENTTVEEESTTDEEKTVKRNQTLENEFGKFLLAKVKEEDREANKTIEIIQNDTKKEEAKEKEFVPARMSAISSTGAFSLKLNSMVNPFLIYPNLTYHEVFESYMEATVDNSKEMSSFISNDNHHFNLTKRSLAKKPQKHDQENLFAKKLEHIIIVNNSVSTPGYIHMQIQFTDLNQVSL